MFHSEDGAWRESLKGGAKKSLASLPREERERLAFELIKYAESFGAVLGDLGQDSDVEEHPF